MLGFLRRIKAWWVSWRCRRRLRRTQRDLAKAFAKTLDERINTRRRAWEAEDAELRAVMAAAAGGNGLSLGRLLGRRDLGGGAIQARFDSAVTTEDNAAHWAMADGLAADAAASPGVRYVLRNRARYEEANNCYCRGVGESIANDFVGCGPRLHIDDERFSPEQRADLEEKWSAWCKAINLPEKLRLMRKARRHDGETFALKITNPLLAHPVKLDLKVVEADRVRFVNIALLLVPSVDGIEFDEYGNAISYNILRVHPGFWSYATGYVGFPWEFDRWPAQRVIHWFRKDRPEQHRGLPEFLPALPLYATLRRFTQATLDAAETAADFAVVIHTKAGAEDAETFNPFSSVPLQRRMISALPEGYEASQLKPEHPTTTYGEFKKEIVAEIGRCEGVPANVVLADSSASNFASGQLDHKIYFRPREIERAEANVLILDNLLADWLYEAALIEAGADGQPYLPQELRVRGATLAHSWHWDSNQLGDPLKLNAADATALKNGTATIPEVWARKGKDWLKAFITGARALGLTLPEYQERVRNAIFGPAEADMLGDAGDSDGGESGVVKPGQAATQSAGRTPSRKPPAASPGAPGADPLAVAPLNGAQISAAVDVMLKLREQAMSPIAATELLTALGIPRERAEAIVRDTPEGLDNTAGDAAFKREVLKALLAVPAAREAVYNGVDIEDLIEQTGLTPEPGYQTPFIPVVAPAGPLVSGDVIRDPQQDVVGGDVVALETENELNRKDAKNAEEEGERARGGEGETPDESSGRTQPAKQPAGPVDDGEENDETQPNG